MLKNVTSGIAKQMAQESSAANLGGGAEAESFSKTLTDIHMDIQPSQLLVIVLVGGLLLILVSILLHNGSCIRNQRNSWWMSNKKLFPKIEIGYNRR